MTLSNMMVDVKSTKHDQIIVTVNMLSKLESDAFIHGKIPVLMLNFAKAKNIKTKWVVVPYDKFFNS